MISTALCGLSALIVALVHEKVAGIEVVGVRTVENLPVATEQVHLRQCCHVAAEIHISIKSRRLAVLGLARAGRAVQYLLCVYSGY